jgi:hypothetical protein
LLIPLLAKVVEMALGKERKQLVRKLVYAPSSLELYHDIINNSTSLVSLYPNVEERL